jgi:hypothetical protein
VQFPVAVPGLDRDDVAAPNFFCLSRISVGYEWDRAPEFESDIGLSISMSVSMTITLLMPDAPPSIATHQFFTSGTWFSNISKTFVVRC